MCHPVLKAHRNDLSLDQLDSLFKSPVLDNLVFLLITGGEPFLRDDLVEICGRAAKTIPGLKQLRMASNGVLKDRIIEKTEEICRVSGLPVSLKISIDGIGERHDRLRGIDGAYDSALNVLYTLEEIKRKKRLDLSLALSFTALDENIDEIRDVYRLVEGRDIDFFFKPGHDFCYETNRAGAGSSLAVSETTRRRLLAFMKDFLDQDFRTGPSFAKSGRKVFYQEMYHFLQNPEKLPLSCSAGFSSFLIFNTGEVYACSSHCSGKVAMGSLNENTLEEIWFSEKAEKIRDMIKQGRCACFTGCELGPSIITCRWNKVVADYLQDGLVKRQATKNVG
jgi:radical SAM protein with 4Fe4S-binding SPASM domain